MKKNVLIVGLGGIGYRHFQAVLKCKSDVVLYAVDISLEAIEKAKKYKIESGYEKEVLFYDDVRKIQNKYFDVTIIATSSKIRRNIFEQILNNNTLRYVILEKVLFNDLSDYKIVEEMIKKNNITVYVNCSGRQNLDYQKLRETLINAKYYKFIYRGSDWGLACNSIHKIDIIAFLTNYEGKDVKLDGHLLEDKIYESKRQGYKEFYGCFTGIMGKNIEFIFECNHGNAPCILDIYTDKEFYSIREGDKIIICDESGSREEPFELEYISNTSTTVVDNLLNNKKVFLTTYEESINYHIPMLEIFIEAQKRITGEDKNICDIT